MTESTLKNPTLQPALDGLKDAVKICRRPCPAQVAPGLIKFAAYQATAAKVALETARPVDPADKAQFVEVIQQLRKAYDELRAGVNPRLESKG